MDQDQVEGMARQAGGRVKDAAGALTGDAEMQAEGKASQLIGEAQQRYGAAIESVQSFAQEKPWQTIGIVAARSPPLPPGRERSWTSFSVFLRALRVSVVKLSKHGARPIGRRRGCPGQAGHDDEKKRLGRDDRNARYRK